MSESQRRRLTSYLIEERRFPQGSGDCNGRAKLMAIGCQDLRAGPVPG
jgi:hypothetical protein